jgi:hypothetical protein
MLRLNGRTLLLGGFHDHWTRCGENSALLMAALNYYHYDFVTLMCGPEKDAPHREIAGRFSDRIRIYLGREEMFGWGHVVTINPRTAPLGGDDGGNYEESLWRLKENCDLAILAHPEYPGTWETLYLTGEMDRLLDTGALDAVNLINTRGFDGHPRLRELINWFDGRDSRGLKTPIAGGWDAHLVLPQRDLPYALYEKEKPPKDHIDTCGANRTILFCEENSLPAIVDAVKQGQTVIEDLQTGELVGPSGLVQFLKESDYAGAITQLDKARDKTRITIASPWISGEESNITLNQAGLLKVAVPTINGLQPAKFSGRAAQDGVISVEAGERVSVEWPDLPFGRNSDYALATFQAPDGSEKIWGVETRHPIQSELLPAYRDGVAGVELRTSHPFAGKVSIQIEGLLEWSGEIEGGKWIQLQTPPQELMYAASWRAELPNGFWREEEIQITFITAHKFDGDWDALPIYAVDEERFVPASGYGATRPYPGKEIFSVYLQFGWNDDHFHMRAKVLDPIHYQPIRGHYAYNADCLQMGIDPVIRRRTSIGHVYSFNLSLNPDGPEFYRWLAPTEEDAPGFVCPQDDVSLGDKFLKVDPIEGGLIYDLKLPWSELAPLTPCEGSRFGIYFIAMNNNGTGLVDTLHWPLHFVGMWLVPSRWGIVNLV